MSSFSIPERSSTHASYSSLFPMLLAEKPERSPRQIALDQFQPMLKACSDNPFCIREDLTELLEEYTADELNRLYVDLQAVADRVFKNPLQKRIYITTAGAPGSGKTSLIESYLSNDSKSAISSYVYINMKKYLAWMEKTYQQDIQQSPHPTDHQEIYNYWKNASYFLSIVFLITSLKCGYAIVQNSTSCTNSTEEFLKKIHFVFHYRITILHITCEDEIRKLSLQNTQIKTQVSAWNEENFTTLGKQFFYNLPIYLKNSDLVLFFHRKTEDQIVLAAKKHRNFRCIVHNDSSYQKIQTLHSGK